MQFKPVSQDQTNLPITARLFAQLCREMNAKLVLDSKFFYFGYIETAEGNRLPIKGGALAINSYSASEAAKDKEFCGHLLLDAHLPTPHFRLIHSDKAIKHLNLASPHVANAVNSKADASALAEQIGFPLFIKPNEGIQGAGVQKVHNHAELQESLVRALTQYDRVLLQQAVTGRDYRVVVLDGEILAVIERRPLSITGNGNSTISELLDQKIKTLKTRGGGYKIDRDDSRILKTISESGHDLNSKLSEGEFLPLLSNANLSTGGEAIDATELASQSFKTLAIEATRVCGLRYAGVDILCDNLSEENAPAHILELNAGPGLTNFWQASPNHHERVRTVYRSVLQAMLNA